jgi:hypothetical protein
MHDDLIARLAATPSALAHLVAELGDAELDASPAGEWSPRTLLAHLRDDEYLCQRLALERMLAEDVPTISVLEGADWEPSRNHARDRKEWLLADFALQRQASLAILRSLQPSDWARRGRVPEHLPFTVEALVQRWVEHDDQHVAQLEATLGVTLAEVKERRARREE